MSDGTHRSVRAQVKDAAKELWLVLAPTVAIGTVAGVVSVLVASLLFEDGWVVATFGVVVMTVTTFVVVSRRLDTLTSKPPKEVAEYE